MGPRNVRGYFMRDDFPFAMRIYGLARKIDNVFIVQIFDQCGC